MWTPPWTCWSGSCCPYRGDRPGRASSPPRRCWRPAARGRRWLLADRPGAAAAGVPRAAPDGGRPRGPSARAAAGRAHRPDGRAAARPARPGRLRCGRRPAPRAARDADERVRRDEARSAGAAGLDRRPGRPWPAAAVVGLTLWIGSGSGPHRRAGPGAAGGGGADPAGGVRGGGGAAGRGRAVDAARAGAGPGLRGARPAGARTGAGPSRPAAARPGRGRRLRPEVVHCGCKLARRLRRGHWCSPRPAARPPGRAGRAERGRQEHGGRAAGPVPRPGPGPGHAWTASTCATWPATTCGPGWRCSTARRTCSTRPSRQNLRLGRPDATDDELRRRAALGPAARLGGDPAGRAATPPVGEGGARLSGGERRRLALARVAAARRADPGPRRADRAPRRGDRARRSPTTCSRRPPGARVVLITHRPYGLAAVDEVIRLRPRPSPALPALDASDPSAPSG